MTCIGHPSINNQSNAFPLRLPHKKNTNLASNPLPKAQQCFFHKTTIEVIPHFLWRPEGLIPIGLKVGIFHHPSINLLWCPRNELLWIINVIGFNRWQKMCCRFWNCVSLSHLQQLMSYGATAQDSRLYMSFDLRTSSNASFGVRPVGQVPPPLTSPEILLEHEFWVEFELALVCCPKGKDARRVLVAVEQLKEFSDRIDSGIRPTILLLTSKLPMPSPPVSKAEARCLRHFQDGGANENKSECSPPLIVEFSCKIPWTFLPPPGQRAEPLM